MSESAENMEVIDPAADIPGHNASDMSDVVSSNEAVDAELTWDNVEEAAPSLEDNSSESGDEWDALGENEEVSEESSNEENVEEGEEASEETGEESKQSDENSDKDSSSEEKEEVEAKEESKEELSNETEIEVKIDGEVQKVSLQELKNNYSGKVAFDKKFNELNKERQEYKKEVESINEYVNELGKTMKEASLLEGFYKVGELVGMAPHNLKQALINELVPEISRLQNLSQDEVDLEYKKQEMDYTRNKYEADQKKFQQEQAQAELHKQVEAIRGEHNINESEWDNAIKYLDEHLPTEEAITPELVGKYVNFERAGTRAEELLNQFDASLMDNKEVFNSLQDSIYENSSLTNEDFMELLQEAYGNAKVEAAEKKVEETVKAKNVEKKQPKKKTGPQPEMVGSKEALDWDDIL